MNLFITAVNVFLGVLQLMVFARVIISWFPLSKRNFFVEFLYQVTEPVLGPVRNLVGRLEFLRGSMFDISPLLVIVIIDILRSILSFVAYQFFGIPLMDGFL